MFPISLSVLITTVDHVHAGGWCFCTDLLTALQGSDAAGVLLAPWSGCARTLNSPVTTECDHFCRCRRLAAHQRVYSIPVLRPAYSKDVPWPYLME